MPIKIPWEGAGQTSWTSFGTGRNRPQFTKSYYLFKNLMAYGTSGFLAVFLVYRQHYRHPDRKKIK